MLSLERDEHGRFKLGRLLLDIKEEEEERAQVYDKQRQTSKIFLAFEAVGRIWAIRHSCP